MLVLSTAQAWFASYHVHIKTIGLLSLLGMPYTWKFLWSPFLDRFIIPIFGKRRGWIAAMQMLLALLMFTLAFQTPTKAPYFIAFLLLLIAFFSASQDIAINAYQTEVLTPAERGIGAAMSVSGYRIAILVSGGIAIGLAQLMGWQYVFIFLGLLMLGNIAITVYAPEPEKVSTPNTLKSAVILPFKDFLTRKNALAILAFIIIYKLGDNLAQALLTTFFIKGLGFSLLDVGSAYKLTGFIGTMLGVYLGGFFVLRIGLFRALLLFGIFQMFSTLTFVWLNDVGKVYPVFIFAVFAETLAAGMGTAAFLAFLMSLCNRHFTATQFAIFSSLDSFGRTFVGPVAAWVKVAYGWNALFIFSALMALPGLLLLLYLGGAKTFSEV